MVKKKNLNAFSSTQLNPNSTQASCVEAPNRSTSHSTNIQYSQILDSDSSHTSHVTTLSGIQYSNPPSVETNTEGFNARDYYENYAL